MNHCSLRHNSWCKNHCHWHHDSVAIAHWLLSASCCCGTSLLLQQNCCNATSWLLPFSLKFSLMPSHAAWQQVPQCCCGWPCICASDATAAVACLLLLLVNCWHLRIFLYFSWYDGAAIELHLCAGATCLLHHQLIVVIHIILNCSLSISHCMARTRWCHDTVAFDTLHMMPLLCCLLAIVSSWLLPFKHAATTCLDTDWLSIVKLKLLFLISKWLALLLLLPLSIFWCSHSFLATLLQGSVTIYGNALACCRQPCCATAATADAMLQLHAATLLPLPLDHCSTSTSSLFQPLPPIDCRFQFYNRSVWLMAVVSINAIAVAACLFGKSLTAGSTCC